MRFSKIIWEISPALLVMAALILIAGAAAGQGNDFFNDAASIKPDEKYKGTGGVLDGTDNVYGTSIWVACSDDTIDYDIRCDTEHPDNVNISKHQGKVDQKKKGNNARATMRAWVLNSLPVVDGPFVADLVCEKIQVKGKYNTKNDKMDLKCTVKKCKFLLGITTADIEDAIDCTEDAVDSGVLGKKATNLKLRNGLISGNISSKGTPIP
jgi:hypothetical protein